VELFSHRFVVQSLQKSTVMHHTRLTHTRDVDRLDPFQLSLPNQAKSCLCRICTILYLSMIATKYNVVYTLIKKKIKFSSYQRKLGMEQLQSHL
jgi:hypothetical protein